MAKANSKVKKQLEETAKSLRAEFSNYENAVTLISSLEAWFEHLWGASGEEDAGRLRKFDRFPHLGDLTPDFAAYFDTPYIVCGEHMKTFRGGQGSKRDAQQVIAYSRWDPPIEGDGRVPGFDVLLLVGTDSDDVAARAIRSAEESGVPDMRPKAPIVIIGYFRDTERVNGDWYSLKWRDSPGNRAFSEPNATANPAAKGLNHLITRQTNCPVRVNEPALDLTARSPLYNDEPPPLYTLVRVVFPVICGLLTDDDRDALRTTGKVEKVLSRDDLLNTPVLQRLKPPPGYIQNALDWLVRNKLARRLGDSQPTKYALTIDTKKLKDLIEVISEKAARAIVQRMRSGGHGKRSKPKESPRQMKLPGI